MRPRRQPVQSDRDLVAVRSDGRHPAPDVQIARLGQRRGQTGGSPGRLVDEFDPVLFGQDWNSIRNTMWNYAGIVRTQKRLKRACDDLGYLGHRIERFYRSTRLSRPLLELRNGIVTARSVAEAARRNPHSRGCHYVKE